MSKRIENFRIRENKRLDKDIFVLEVAGESKLPELKPGQFVQVKIENSPETFLRRPLSIHDVDYKKNTIKFLIQIAGKGTEKLSRIRIGETINLIYPLGNSFSLPLMGEKLLLVGGGCGVAPLLFLGKYLKLKGHIPEILLGFKDKEHIIEYDDYKTIGKTYLTTEDGSCGEKGLVTDHPVLRQGSYDRIFCCGPEPMLKAVSSFCFNNKIECEVSLENLMACGIGVCLCCVVDTQRGHLCTCTDGPVFNIKDLKWQTLVSQ